MLRGERYILVLLFLVFLKLCGDLTSLLSTSILECVKDFPLLGEVVAPNCVLSLLGIEFQLF